MSKKKYNKNSITSEEVRDPLAVYRGAGITFSSIETQGDVLLKMSMSKNPAERLAMLIALNEYTYKNNKSEKLIFKNARITFSAYEYIP